MKIKSIGEKLCIINPEWEIESEERDYKRYCKAIDRKAKNDREKYLELYGKEFVDRYDLYFMETCLDDEEIHRQNQLELREKHNTIS